MKASKMVACLSVSAVLLSLFASGLRGDGTGYTALCGGGLAGGGICRGLPGRLSGRARFRRHPLRPDHFAAGCRGGVTSDLEQPVSWTFECEEAGFYNVYVEYIPLPGTGEAIERSLLLDGESPYKGHGAVGIPALLRQHVGRGNPDEGQRGNPSARHRGF